MFSVSLVVSSIGAFLAKRGNAPWHHRKWSSGYLDDHPTQNQIGNANAKHVATLEFGYESHVPILLGSRGCGRLDYHRSLVGRQKSRISGQGMPEVGIADHEVPSGNDRNWPIAARARFGS